MRTPRTRSAKFPLIRPLLHLLNKALPVVRMNPALLQHFHDVQLGLLRKFLVGPGLGTELSLISHRRYPRSTQHIIQNDYHGYSFVDKYNVCSKYECQESAKWLGLFYYIPSLFWMLSSNGTIAFWSRFYFCRKKWAYDLCLQLKTFRMPFPAIIAQIWKIQPCW